MVALYWKNVPYRDDATSYGRLIASSHFEKMHELIVPLKVLIAISEKADIQDEALKGKIAYWKKQMENPEIRKKYQTRFAVKDDPNTLRAYLLGENIIT